jgi:peptidoglycan/xylan/chitin deacetylase (PgdA/CDA1 family)
MQPEHYRSRREERRRRLRRRRVSLAAVVLALIVAVVLAVAVSPRLGGLSLPWSGGSGDSTASAASSGASTDGSLHIIGAEDVWYHGPVTLRFRDAEGKPVAAGYRIDDGDWEEGKRVHVPGPADHGNDGMHTVEARPLDGGEPVASVKVGIDTRPPELSGVTLSPERTDGTGSVKLSFIAPPEEGVTVEWAVVDVLGKPVGEQGAPGAPSGPVAVTWQVPKVGGEKLGPGTYWLRVLATDKAGNITEERASLACVRPVKARVITSLPAAGNEVALTFDGGSGPAWHSQMDTLYENGALGTWFCTGVSVDRSPKVARMAVEQGQSLGNHSYDHPDFSRISYEEQLSQLERNTEAWWKACKAVPQPFFRPPYGSQTATTVKAAGDAGYRYVVMWNGDSGDWTGLPAGQVAAKALAAAKPGAIIVFHTQWNSDAALPAILKGLEKKGLKAVSLAQLCADAGLPY